MRIDFRTKFLEGQEYKRSAIHDLFGGSRQAGISCPADQPYIFIFSGSQGSQHGYIDGWEENGIFSYTGHGQKGDMKFASGNKQLRDHIKNGKTVFLFEYTRKAMVKLVGELDLKEFEFFHGPDTLGNQRRAIKFYFERVSDQAPKPKDNSSGITKEPDFDSYIIPAETDKLTLTTRRVGHTAYRNRLFERWNYKCCITGYDDPRILIASHIVGWKDASDKEKLDVHNGLVLTPTYDTLFDRHLISFDDTGKILFSDSLNSKQLTLLGITGDEHIAGLTKNNKAYLAKHRHIFEAKVNNLK